MRPTVHYMVVINPRPLIIIRTPYPLPRWNTILKALTQVMRSHGYKQKDISEIEGLTPYPGDTIEPWTPEHQKFIFRLEKAFSGDSDILSAFWLYDWKDGEFVLARRPKTTLSE